MGAAEAGMSGMSLGPPRPPAGTWQPPSAFGAPGGGVPPPPGASAHSLQVILKPGCTGWVLGHTWPEHGTSAALPLLLLTKVCWAGGPSMQRTPSSNGYAAPGPPPPGAPQLQVLRQLHLLTANPTSHRFTRKQLGFSRQPLLGAAFKDLCAAAGYQRQDSSHSGTYPGGAPSGFPAPPGAVVPPAAHGFQGMPGPAAPSFGAPRPPGGTPANAACHPALAHSAGALLAGVC